MAGLQQNVNRTVSVLKPAVTLPMGNAETIANSLGPYRDEKTRLGIRAAAETGFFSYDSSSCMRSGGGVGVGSQLAQVGVITGVKAGLNAIPVVGGALSSLASFALKPFQHHAQAVKTEQVTLCEAVPDANNFLRGIDAQVASGQLDTATAVQVMEQGYQNWRANSVGAIIKDSGGQCNAACVLAKAFRAAIEKRKLDYALIDAQKTAGAQGLLHGVANALGGAVASVGSVVGRVFSPSGGTVSASVDAASVSPAGPRTLTGFLIVGGALVAGVLWFQFIRGAKK